MSKEKYLGIWMDHSSAHLIESENGIFETQEITSSFNHQVKEQTLEKSEKEMHHKENNEQLAFYKDLGKVIINHNTVLLFGPTEAKTELLNLLRKDHRFDKITIEVKPADKMSKKEQQAFVQHFYLTNLNTRRAGF